MHLFFIRLKKQHQYSEKVYYESEAYVKLIFCENTSLKNQENEVLGLSMDCNYFKVQFDTEESLIQDLKFCKTSQVDDIKSILQKFLVYCKLINKNEIYHLIVSTNAVLLQGETCILQCAVKIKPKANNSKQLDIYPRFVQYTIIFQIRQM